MIPKRIIATHQNLTALNDTHHRCLAKMRELHPGWDVEFFSDGDCLQFMNDHQPAYSELYQWLPRAVMKADLFRVAAVEKLGGFYLDLDVRVDQPLDPLLAEQGVFPWEHEMKPEHFAIRFPGKQAKVLKRWQVGNYAFGSVAGHPFLRAILREIVARTASFHQEFCSDEDVLHATGPDVVTTVYYRQPAMRKDVTVMWGVDAQQKVEHRFGGYGAHLLTGVWKGGN